MADSTSGIQTLPARETELGSLKILRALPRSRRRMVGPWCFLDRYGPLSFTSGKPMDVAPHPHIGIQTISWLLAGEINHHDSLGNEALMQAGQLNLMTAGRGIAHSEETPQTNSGALNGVQLWVALPEAQRNMQPEFFHYPSLPVIEFSGGAVTVITGALLQHSSPAKVFSPIVGAEIAFRSREPLTLPVEREFEHALFVLDGDVSLDTTPIEAGALHCLGLNRDELRIDGASGSRILLIGGKPFGEPILMWWNFVARTRQEIRHAREEWMRHEAFGEVRGYKGPRVPAPEFL